MILVTSPLLLAVSDEYLEGVQLLLSRIDRCGSLGEVSECLQPALTFSDTSILDALLLQAKSQEIKSILPVIVAKNSESTKTVLKRKWSKHEAHKSLQDAIVSGIFGVAEFVLTTWDLPSKRALDVMYRHAERSDVSDGKEELLKLILSHREKAPQFEDYGFNEDEPSHSSFSSVFGSVPGQLSFQGWDINSSIL